MTPTTKLLLIAAGVGTGAYLLRRRTMVQSAQAISPAPLVPPTDASRPARLAPRPAAPGAPTPAGSAMAGETLVPPIGRTALGAGDIPTIAPQTSIRLRDLPPPGESMQFEVELVLELPEVEWLAEWTGPRSVKGTVTRSASGASYEVSRQGSNALVSIFGSQTPVYTLVAGEAVAPLRAWLDADHAGVIVRVASWPIALDGDSGTPTRPHAAGGEARVQGSDSVRVTWLSAGWSGVAFWSTSQPREENPGPTFRRWRDVS